MTNRTAVRRLNIFEVINYERRESLIALVPDALGPLVTRLRTLRPPPIAHWGPDEVYAVEQIVAADSGADAEEKMRSILGKPRCASWKVLVWRG